LRAKLTDRGCSEALAAEVAAALAAEGLVSDERFVEALIHARRARGYGPLFIRRELEERRIGRELIGRWVNPGDREWIEDLRRVKKKKFGGRRPASLAERARQTRFLQSRGFTHEQIRAVLGSDDE
jgi:regulatory protein